jgi:hypothetical protein
LDPAEEGVIILPNYNKNTSVRIGFNQPNGGDYKSYLPTIDSKENFVTYGDRCLFIKKQAVMVGKDGQLGIQFAVKGDTFDGMYDKGISEIHEDRRL